MRCLTWKDKYTQMGKPYPQPKTIELKNIKLTLKNDKEIIIPYGKKTINIQKYNPKNITFEMIERGNIVKTTYRFENKGKKKKKKKKKKN